MKDVEEKWVNRMKERKRKIKFLVQHGNTIHGTFSRSNGVE